MTRKHRALYVLLAALALAALGSGGWWMWQSKPSYSISPGASTVERAFHERQSEIMVEVSGRVVRLLMDDPQSPDCQQFVIRLENGQAVRVVHDTSRAPAVPLAVDDILTVRGEYRWTETGGVIQFTNRDHSRARRHGWIEHEGRRYD